MTTKTSRKLKTLWKKSGAKGSFKAFVRSQAASGLQEAKQLLKAKAGQLKSKISDAKRALNKVMAAATRATKQKKK